jgi:ABC-type amino acid transport substrate-binding protein
MTEFETRGLPGVYVASSEFEEAGAAQARALGFEPFLAGAVASRPADKSLFDAFQKEFKAMKASGEFDKIAKQFNFPPFPADLKNTTAQEACSKVS